MVGLAPQSPILVLPLKRTVKTGTEECPKDKSQVEADSQDGSSVKLCLLGKQLAVFGG